VVVPLHTHGGRGEGSTTELLERVSKKVLDILPELNPGDPQCSDAGRRQQYLKAEPYQHSEEREGTPTAIAEDVQTRVGSIHSRSTGARRGLLPGSVGKGLAE